MGVGSVVVDCRVFGAPRFSVQRSQNTYFEGFGASGRRIGAPKKRENQPRQIQLSISQKKRDVHKISARNSGAGIGYAIFLGAWHFLVLSAGKPPCP